MSVDIFGISVSGLSAAISGRKATTSHNIANASTAP